jgi:hypothetical protein
MYPLVMNNLKLISLFFFIIIGCSPKIHQKYVVINDHAILNGENVFFPFQDKSITYLYKAKVEVYGNYLSGLLAIKKIGEGYRMIFTSETGIKFFDFEFSENQFIVHECMEKLNKKSVLRTLEKDLGMLVFYQLFPNTFKLVESLEKKQMYTHKYGKEYVYITLNDKFIENILVFDKKKLKKEVNFHTFENEIPQGMSIAHSDIKLKINLNYINR